ncbi:hypothetical protein LEP1GSC185_3460 [Leptospira licerasiae serovar Varillal str. VAR 010]|nr:hypothetical protein LEP1GSC185_3460 [Leptospira licerasiae serovar Varillal str. VAR 010]
METTPNLKAEPFISLMIPEQFLENFPLTNKSELRSTKKGKPNFEYSFDPF